MSTALLTAHHEACADRNNDHDPYGCQGCAGSEES